MLWIICENSDSELRKTIELKYVDIVLDLTVEKNLNVCQSVYVTMIDHFLSSFVKDDEGDVIPQTIIKRNKRDQYVTHTSERGDDE